MVLAIAYLAATAWRCLSIDLFGWRSAYFRFDTRLSALILGSLLNVVERHREGTSGLLTDILSRRTLVQVGKISYGLYLYHYPLTYWLYGKDWRLVLAVTLPAALLLAALSYRYLEQPILNGRALPWLFPRSAPEHRPDAAEPAPPALTPIKAIGPL
jgi:peptidoglycan/LPS O-acetylase OafA/YrhL